jgi:arylsulfatase A-like enzyme
MNRRTTHGNILAPLAGLLVLIALLGWWLWPAPSPQPTATATGTGEPVPVIVYVIDTLRADRLGLYGYGKPTSPRLEALAKESVVFDRAEATGPWTLPSVSSLVTSRYPCEHGMINLGLKLSPKIPTLAEILQGRGFATVAYYQNDIVGPISGLDRGYQVTEHRADIDTMDQDVKGFLDRAGGGPFLLYLHSMEPHTPFYTPTRYFPKLGAFAGIDDREAFREAWIAYRKAWYRDSRAQKPLGTTDTTAELDRAMSNLRAMKQNVDLIYDAAVLFADDELGQTIDVIKNHGLWNKALFIVMADHGEELDDHGLWLHDQSVYQELLHVPLLIHFPDGAHGGTRVAERVSLLDVMPTILDYLGESGLCAGCRGTSLLPLLRGQADAYRSPEVPAMRMNLSGYYRPVKETRGDLNVVVRDGNLKGIWNAEPRNTEIYDLDTDPAERSNLGSADAARAQALAARAAEWLTGCEASLQPPDKVPLTAKDSAIRERLKAHGYFSAGDGDDAGQ